MFAPSSSVDGRVELSTQPKTVPTGADNTHRDLTTESLDWSDR